jgi:hypothetical protein
MNERWPDRKAGQKVDACGRKLFSVLIFWLLLYQDKSNSPPRQLSGPMFSIHLSMRDAENKFGMTVG